MQPRLRQAWRRQTLRLGTDITEASDRRSCLVLAPHPDDETLGCGATIAGKRLVGTPVTVVIAADGRYAQRASAVVSPAELREMRAAEAVEACRILGVEGADLIQLGHEDTRLDTTFATLVEQLREVIVERQPEEILVASRFDFHPDHQTLNRALRSLREHIPDGCRVAEFPVWFWVDGPWLELSARSLSSRAWHFLSAPVLTLRRSRADLVSTSGVLELKQRALHAHASQTSNLTGEPAWGIMDTAFLADFLMPYEPFFPGSADLADDESTSK